MPSVSARRESQARPGLRTALVLRLTTVLAVVSLLAAPQTLAFGLDTHDEIVRSALSDQMDGEALDSVVGSWWLAQGNLGSDMHQFTPELHFDSAPDRQTVCERWRKSIDRLLDSVVTTADPTGVSPTDRLRQREAALEAFGQATHALADFYSHSNYVELAYQQPELGLLDADGLPRTAPLSGSCDPNNLPPGLQTGYFNLLYGLDGCPTRNVAPEGDLSLLGEPSDLDQVNWRTEPAPPAGFTYCHEQIAKDEPDSGHGADLVPGRDLSYYYVAKVLATRSTRALWETLRQRFRDTVDSSLWNADCLFDDLAHDRSSSAQPLGERCRPPARVPAPADATRAVAALHCFVRRPTLFARAKNFADHDVALTDSSATIKGAVGNTLGTGTRSWDTPAARLCAGDQVQLTLRAGGQLALTGHFWLTTGITEPDSSRMRNFPPPWPDKDFFALPPGGDLAGTSGSRVYHLTVADSQFSLGVWVRSGQGDAGLIVWSYAQDTSSH